MAYLADAMHIAPTSIKAYWSSVGSLHKNLGWPDPLQSTPHTQRVLAGVKRVHGLYHRLHRLPINGTILTRLAHHLRAAPWLTAQHRLMLTAACTIVGNYQHLLWETIADGRTFKSNGHTLPIRDS